MLFVKENFLLLSDITFYEGIIFLTQKKEGKSPPFDFILQYYQEYA